MLETAQCEHLEIPDNIECEFCNAYPNCPLHALRHPSTSSNRSGIFKLIEDELVRQDEKWGADRVLDQRLWIAIIGEEFGEVCKADLEHDPDGWVAELIDVAASAIAAIYSYQLSRASIAESE